MDSLDTKDEPKQPYDQKTFFKIVGSFAVAETLVWAAYYYSFAAFFPTWEAELKFSKPVLTGAFTMALIVAAFAAPLVGRLIDFGHGKSLFSGGALVAGVLLLLLSQVTEVWQFYLIWFGIGLAMSSSLYEACFALITYTMGLEARRAITYVTLIAGFASTISFPSAHILIKFFDWRVALIIFGVIIITVAVPLIIYGSKQAAYYAREKRQSPSPTARKAMLVAKTWTFWLIAVTFTLAACAHGMITTHMLPILIDRGFTAEMAVLGASMIGPMQVAGRVIMTLFERHVSVLAICLVSFLSIFIAGLALYYSNAIPLASAVFVIGQGAGYGVFSIIRPTIIAQLLGRQNFGIIAGFLAIGFMLGSAVSPTIASLLWEASDYGLVILVAAFLPIVCLITLTFAWRYRVKSSDND